MVKHKTAARFLMTRPQLAAAMGVDSRTISRWEKDGLPTAGRPRRGTATRFDARAVRAWHEQQFAPSAPAKLALDQERAKLARAQCAKLDLELAVRRGELISVEEVKQLGVACILVWRRQVLSFPAQLVQVGLVAPKDKEAVKAIVYQLLREIAASKFPAKVDLPGLEQGQLEMERAAGV